MPRNLSGLREVLARLDIGKVEVLEASMHSADAISSACWMILDLTCGSSNTASIMRSQSLSALNSVVAEILFKKASLPSILNLFCAIFRVGFALIGF